MHIHMCMCSYHNTGTDTVMMIQRAVALWILKSRELHKIPVSVMDGIAKDLQSLFDVMTESIRSTLYSILTGAANLTEAKAQINTYMSEWNFNILQGLHSQSAQVEYFRNPLNIIVGHYITLTLMHYTCTLT